MIVVQSTRGVGEAVAILEETYYRAVYVIMELCSMGMYGDYASAR